MSSHEKDDQQKPAKGPIVTKDLDDFLSKVDKTKPLRVIYRPSESESPKEHKQTESENEHDDLGYDKHGLKHVRKVKVRSASPDDEIYTHNIVIGGKRLKKTGREG